MNYIWNKGPNASSWMILQHTSRNYVSVPPFVSFVGKFLGITHPQNPTLRFLPLITNQTPQWHHLTSIPRCGHATNRTVLPNRRPFNLLTSNNALLIRFLAAEPLLHESRDYKLVIFNHSVRSMRSWSLDCINNVFTPETPLFYPSSHLQMFNIFSN
ncbi:hypothetical protein AHF37_07263 [Paragonimus kellicotti]|nr:hypothetical protein AHF37_07263 [Paragonimus kellicotti]